MGYRARHHTGAVHVDKKMLDESHPDLVAAFPGGAGTEDMVRRAKKAGVLISRVIVVG